MAMATVELQKRMYKARATLAVAGRWGASREDVDAAVAEVAACRIESAIVENSSGITEEARVRLIEILASQK
ncbi:hypothetical protein ACWEQU_05735 [Streptomyces nodosus]